MVGEQQVVGRELDGAEEGPSCGSSTSGASSPVALNTCASAEPPRRFSAGAEVDQQQVGFALVEHQLRRQRAARPDAGQSEVTISDSGETTCFFCTPIFPHAVRIDSESLPTGIEMPICWQRSDTARTVSNRRASSPGVAGGSHPVGGELDVAELGDVGGGDVGQRFADGHAAEAGASRTASGVRSPMAKASPAKP